jgi:hypothetical protein
MVGSCIRIAEVLRVREKKGMLRFFVCLDDVAEVPQLFSAQVMQHEISSRPAHQKLMARFGTCLVAGYVALRFSRLPSIHITGRGRLAL